MQKRLSKQVKGSKRRNRTKHKISKTQKKIRNTRKDFCHKSSRTIVDKALFKVAPNYTSQECADCGHTQPENRKSQEIFSCLRCGNTGNADENAAKVIKNRAIDLILDSGTELSKRGVLLDSGRGAHMSRSQDLVSSCARAKKRPKRRKKLLA